MNFNKLLIQESTLKRVPHWSDPDPDDPTEDRRYVNCPGGNRWITPFSDEETDPEQEESGSLFDQHVIEPEDLSEPWES